MEQSESRPILSIDDTPARRLERKASLADLLEVYLPDAESKLVIGLFNRRFGQRHLGLGRMTTEETKQGTVIHLELEVFR